MVQNQLVNTDPPLLHAIMNKFLRLNFNSIVHFGQNIDFWPHDFLDEFT